MYRLSKITFLIVLIFSFISCNSEAQEHHEEAMKLEPLDVQQLNTILQIKGATKDGNYKIKVPQNDLGVMVNGFKIIPPMGTTSWVAFTPAPDGARIFGDIVVRETEVRPIEQALFKHGLHATALHKHFEQETPRIMFMHIGGGGSQKSLARGVRAVLDKIENLRGENPSKASTSPVKNTLDTDAITKIIGHEGSTTDGVFKISMGRPDLHVEMAGGEHHEEYGEENEDHEEYEEAEESEQEEQGEKSEENEEHEKSEVHVIHFTGLGSYAAFQGTPEKAAVAGDIAMRADEVEPVMKTLVENGFKVVSLHNHMIDEHPRIFFLHYWKTGNAQELAKGFRDALDQTKKTEQKEENGEKY